MQAFTKQLELLFRVMKELKDYMDSMKQQISWVDWKKFNISKEKMKVTSFKYL
jgi:hypothetical protein